MKIMSAFTLLFSLVALVLTGMFVLANWNPNINLNDIWKFVSFWPATLIGVIAGVFNNPASFLQLGPFVYVTLVVHIGSVITAAMLARSLDRSVMDWGIATFIFPYLAPFFLAFLPEH